MGILGSIVKGVTGKSKEPSDPKAMGGIIEMLTSGETGGIQGLINKLKEGGLKTQVN